MEFITTLYDWGMHFFQVIFNLDVHLTEWITYFGPGIYAILFLIIFCETGLVVTPFLPGDSLLFALGAFTAGESAPLSFVFLFTLLTAGGILGDAVNYAIGRRVGPKIFASPTSRFLNKQHLLRTQAFYEKYGGKTIVFARFIPIIRTFAPFVAGIGEMKYARFAMFNVVGAVLWVGIFLALGHWFGNLPAVKKNFHYVIFGIIVVSALPPVIEWIRVRRSAPASGKAA